MSELNNTQNIGIFTRIARSLFGREPNCIKCNKMVFYGFGTEESTKRAGYVNLVFIYYFLVNAKGTIDVCMPSLTSETIAKGLITAKQRSNAKIRIIIHNSEDFRKLQSFAQNGMEVKVISTERLEHEFILVDVGCDNAVAVVGSLDYDTERVNCNPDATMAVSETAVIKSLTAEFERIWKDTELNIRTEK